MRNLGPQIQNSENKDIENYLQAAIDLSIVSQILKLNLLFLQFVYQLLDSNFAAYLVTISQFGDRKQSVTRKFTGRKDSFAKTFQGSLSIKKGEDQSTS